MVEEKQEDMGSSGADIAVQGTKALDPETQRVAGSLIAGVVHDLDAARQILPADNARSAEAREILRASIATLQVVCQALGDRP